MDEAGIATEYATTRRDALKIKLKGVWLKDIRVNSQISHQPGDRLIASSRQTTELTNHIRFARAVQIMKEHVPTFQACRCQGRGTSTMTKQMKKQTG